MPRLVTVFIVVAGACWILYATRPTKQDFFEELQHRATTMQERGQDNMDKLVGANPLDEMVIGAAPERIIKDTYYEDYYLVSVFHTRYTAPSRQEKRVRIYGFLSTFYPSSRAQG